MPCPTTMVEVMEVTEVGESDIKLKQILDTTDLDKELDDINRKLYD